MRKLSYRILAVFKKKKKKKGREEMYIFSKSTR